jgi:hypothetical protein
MPRSEPTSLVWLKKPAGAESEGIDGFYPEGKILDSTINIQHPGSGSFDSREAMLYNRHTPERRIFLHVNN